MLPAILALPVVLVLSGEPRVLSLDLGTNTGFARWTQGVRDSGTVEFKVSRGSSPGMRYVAFQKWLEGQCVAATGEKLVDLIVYEMPHNRGGAATEVLNGFATHLQSFAGPRGIEHVAVHSSIIKKFVTGRGNAKKPEMVQAVGEKWGRAYQERPQRLDDNEADAIALLEYAKAELIARPLKAASAP